ncbi:porin [Variovorax humicola]|uniref:Porin n=1 Tax=Variovorax humicola TaxID=1769758 RepID=A0ABU8W301_9BURK
MYRRIALAAPFLIAGSGAFAQSSVTMSGYLDAGVYRDSAGTWNVGPIQRSNIAFSGVEDLGNGLAATFMLSHRFETDTGENESSNKPYFHGESTVGLKGGFGSIRLGRALDAMYGQDWQFDPWGYFDRVASPAWDLWHYNYPSDPFANRGGPDYGRINNGVFYDSPTYEGFSIHLSTAARENTRTSGFAPAEAMPLNSGTSTQPYGVSLNYNKGPFAAMVAHERNSVGNTDTFIGLKGSLGNLTAMAAWDRSVAGTSTARTVTAGLQYTIGPAMLRGGWGKVVVDGTRVEQVIGAGANYFLSKRTSLYVDLARKNYVTKNSTVYGVGMAHSF